MPTSTSTPRQTLVDLETKFWQSMVDQDTDTAVALLTEPATMVSAHGAFQFDHATYRKMADQGEMVVTAFKLSDMEVAFPTDEMAILTYSVKQNVAPRGEKNQAGTEQQMHDSSTWIHTEGRWQCVMHTESPAEGAKKATKH